MKTNKVLFLSILSMGTLMQAASYKNLAAFQADANTIASMSSVQRAKKATDALIRFQKNPVLGGQETAKTLVGYLTEKGPRSRMETAINGINNVLDRNQALLDKIKAAQNELNTILISTSKGSFPTASGQIRSVSSGISPNTKDLEPEAIKAVRQAASASARQVSRTAEKELNNIKANVTKVQNTLK